VRSGLAEVWVVDNDSSDGSPELVEADFGWAKLVRSGANLGYGRAVNEAARQSSAPWLAAANADVEVEPGALKRLLAAGADEGVGALAPRLILPDGTTQHSVYRFPTLGFLLLFNIGLYRLLPRGGDRLLLEGHWNAESERIVPWAIGAFLLLRRSAFERAGGFDPGQWMYAEDLDLCWRLNQAGSRVLYVPAAHVRHASGAAARQAFGDQPYERWMAATYDWMERRRGRHRARAAARLNLAGALLRRDRRWSEVHRTALQRWA